MKKINFIEMYQNINLFVSEPTYVALYLPLVEPSAPTLKILEPISLVGLFWVYYTPIYTKMILNTFVVFILSFSPIM